MDGQRLSKTLWPLIKMFVRILFTMIRVSMLSIQVPGRRCDLLDCSSVVSQISKLVSLKSRSDYMIFGKKAALHGAY